MNIIICGCWLFTLKCVCVGAGGEERERETWERHWETCSVCERNKIMIFLTHLYEVGGSVSSPFCPTTYTLLLVWYPASMASSQVSTFNIFLLNKWMSSPSLECLRAGCLTTWQKCVWKMSSHSGMAGLKHLESHSNLKVYNSRIWQAQ